MRKKILFFPLIALLLSIKGYAINTTEIMDAQKDILELDRLERAAEPYLGNLDLDKVQFEEEIQEILNNGLSEINGVWKKALKSGIILLTIVLFEGIADTIWGIGKPGTLSALSLAVVLGITAISISEVKTMIGLGEQTMNTMTEFTNILFPAISALAAATGAITGSAIRQMITILFTNLLMNLMTNFLIPVIYAYLAVSAAYAAVGNDGLKRIAGFIKWVVITVLTAVLTAFVGYLTISGAISGQTDKAALKATKFAFSSAIPVVGKLLSDAAESVLAGCGILKGTVGVYGMLAILAICIVPFLRLGIHYLMYKLTAALAATVGGSRTVGLIENIGGAFGFILGMTGAEMLMLLLSIISALSVTSI